MKHPLPPNLEAVLQRTFTIREQMLNGLRVLKKNELAAGMALANLALQSRDPKAVSRRTALARQAYDTIMRLSQHTERQSEQFTAELDRLKVALRKLGERV